MCKNHNLLKKLKNKYQNQLKENLEHPLLKKPVKVLNKKLASTLGNFPIK
jgi:hypothetical protein